ncbi:M23 family metallopeptidase [bacterium]|nr:M23 family metallopeptidase [bacterium]
MKRQLTALFVGLAIAPQTPCLASTARIAEKFTPVEAVPAVSYILPTEGILTSGYGRRWGRMHQGIDIGAPVGNPIVAAASGTVERAEWNDGGYGNLLELRHSDGSLTRYAHASEILVSVGQTVAQGEAIALVGCTGRCTGPHLHFEIRLADVGAVDPLSYLENHVAQN